MLPNRSKRARTTRASASGPQLTAEDVARIVAEQMKSMNSISKGCTYKYFASCNPPNFDGTGGVVGIHRWLERMEVILEVSECLDNNKVKYAASLFQNHALTRWNTQVLAMSKEVASALTWEEFKNILLEEYRPMNEIEKLEEEYWNHSMVGADIEAYTTRFHELASILPDMFPTEQERIDRYIRGLIHPIKFLMLSSKYPTLRCAIDVARGLVDLKIAHGELTKGALSNEPKQVTDNNRMFPKISQNQAIGSCSMTVKKRGESFGKTPSCNRCQLHHYGPCPSCNTCGKMGHRTRSCRKNPRGPKTCYVCGSLDHLRRDCPKLISD